MNTTVTRQVILDLWPLCVSGDASADSQAIVEAFLASDPAFASTLRDSAGAGCVAGSAPSLSPDHELRALARTRQRLRGYPWLLLLASLFTSLAFGRIISDTSWDVSPRQFIVTASIAVAFWIAFIVTLIRNRTRILLVDSRRRPR
jgi:hypothetical protein